MKENEPKRGREVVIGKEEIPDTDGRAFVFHVEFDPDADPVPADLEAEMLKNASSSAMREILADSIAKTRQDKSGG